MFIFLNGEFFLYNICFENFLNEIGSCILKRKDIFNIIIFDWYKDLLDIDYIFVNIILFVFDNFDYMYVYIGKCLLIY